MRSGPGFIAVLAAMMAAIGQSAARDQAPAAAYEITMRPGLVYATHDRTKLLGDLYLPKGRSKAPVLVAIHGGGWRGGGRSFYKYWGPFLARHGYALFTIEYRLGKSGVYPAAIYDVKAAIQFARAKAAEFDLDPDRIGLIGDSAGGYLAAMLALAGDRFTTAYRDDVNAMTPANVKAVVGFYGIYDMLGQWKQDMTVTPGDSITQDFLRASPARNRQIYLDSSPITYVRPDRKEVRFLLIHGERDDLVDPAGQSGAFNTALTQAGFVSRLIVVPGAAHYWASSPFEYDPRSYGAMVAPQVLQFLDESL
jgi:acetyl esterase/lipase